MPRQSDPPAPETASTVTVRRAVTVPVPDQDPGAELRPRIPESAVPRPAASGPAAEPAPEPAPAPPAPAPVPESSAEAPPATGPGRFFRRRSQTGTAEQQEPGAAQEAAQEAAREERTAEEPDAGLALLTATGGHGDGADTSDSDERPPGRPRGPLLAAAGIAGALLIAVPFLVLAMTSDDDRSVSAAPAGGTTLDPGMSEDGPAADYSAQSPSPSPSGSKATAAKSPSPGVKAAVQGAEEEPVGEEKKEKGKEGDGAEQSSGDLFADDSGTEEKATTKKASEPTARDLANAASSQSAVLLGNTSTGRCADLPDHGKGQINGPVRQFYCQDGSSDNQQWNLKVVSAAGGPGGASLFVVQNVKDGLCFDLPKYGSVGKGTKVVESTCNTTGADNQLWYLEPHENDTYALRNVVANLCLGVNGGKSAGNDADLQVMTCGENQYTAQRWIFA